MHPASDSCVSQHVRRCFGRGWSFIGQSIHLLTDFHSLSLPRFLSLNKLPLIDTARDTRPEDDTHHLPSVRPQLSSPSQRHHFRTANILLFQDNESCCLRPRCVAGRRTTPPLPTHSTRANIATAHPPPRLRHHPRQLTLPLIPFHSYATWFPSPCARWMPFLSQLPPVTPGQGPEVARHTERNTSLLSPAVHFPFSCASGITHDSGRTS